MARTRTLRLQSSSRKAAVEELRMSALRPCSKAAPITQE